MGLSLGMKIDETATRSRPTSVLPAANSPLPLATLTMRTTEDEDEDSISRRERA